MGGTEYDEHDGLTMKQTDSQRYPLRAAFSKEKNRVLLPGSKTGFNLPAKWPRDPKNPVRAATTAGMNKLLDKGGNRWEARTMTSMTV